MKDKENKLIAEFMGHKLGLDGDGMGEPQCRIFENGLGTKRIEDTYNKSWDWLMPVIEKIENDGLDPHGMIDNSLRKNNQKRWRSIEDLHNVAVYLINIYNNGR
tara:strand:+ start:756 stop:1067 length:312 start_codon:yes stop_codon:yes gene_type:complete